MVLLLFLLFFFLRGGGFFLWFCLFLRCLRHWLYLILVISDLLCLEFLLFVLKELDLMIVVLLLLVKYSVVGLPAQNVMVSVYKLLVGWSRLLLLFVILLW